MKVLVNSIRRSRESGRRMGKALNTVIDTKEKGSLYQGHTNLKQIEYIFITATSNQREEAVVVDIRKLED